MIDVVSKFFMIVLRVAFTDYALSFPDWRNTLHGVIF